MKTGWNKKTNMPTMEFEESDYIAAAEIERMLESNAWRTLKGYFASRRLAIEELGKSHARSRAKKEICSNVFSILDGFDQAIELADKVVLQARMLRELDENKRKYEEARNVADDDAE